MSKPYIVVISGPSGAGKTVLSNKLKDENFSEILSVTTRQPRSGEKQGQHYDFITPEKFEELSLKNKLIEKVEVNGNKYGITDDEVLKVTANNKPIVVVAEPHGVAQIKDYCEEKKWNCLSVFINSPVDILMKRLLNRYDSEVENLDKNKENYHEMKEKIHGIYASRIEHVFFKEQKEWVQPAYSENTIFDLVFDEFNEKVEKNVIEKIIMNLTLNTLDDTMQNKLSR